MQTPCTTEGAQPIVRDLSMSEPRTIKKYPNRRLYDTVERRPRTAAGLEGAAGRSAGLDVAHRQADASLAVDLEHLHANHIPFLELVADTLDALVGDLRDVHQAVAPGEDGHESAEIHQARDLAFVHLTHFDIRGDELDAPLRLAPGRT